MGEYCTAVVLAAGKGSRMGMETAKQYLEIEGIPIMAYALKAFQESDVIQEIILITDKEHMEYCQEEIVKKYGFSKVSTVRVGGAQRYESVWNSLCALIEDHKGEDAARQRREGYVMIHDGARPFIDSDTIERVYKAVKCWKACIVGMPVKDTVKLVDQEGCIVDSPNRNFVWQAQTPQAFSVPLIAEAFRKQLKEDCSHVTDDAMVVEAQMGIKVHIVEGSYENIKITTPEDLEIANTFIRKRKQEKS